MSRSEMQSFGVNLPKDLLKELDIMRGDVNRSRYIQRLIEEKNTIMQAQPKIPSSEGPASSSTKRKTS